MATILDLFKSNKTEIYGGVGGQTYIESQGIVNIPRQTALLASSPNSIGGLIGNEVGGLVKGSADRASDTIFKGKEAFRKPLIINPGAVTRGLRYAVEEGEEYYIKRFNEPASFINKITQGANTPGGVIQEEAARFLKNPANTAEAIKTIGKRLKNIKGDSDTYGPGLSEDRNFTFRKTEKKFSDYVPTYNGNQPNGFVQTNLVERDKTKVIDNVINHIINAESIAEYAAVSDFEKLNEKIGGSYVLIQKYKAEGGPSTADAILLPGTVSGISEDITPEWNTFKYLGSPFNLYRYGGVERNIKFNLKLYYVDHSSKITMIRKLDSLRSLVFPEERLAAITYSSGKDNALLAIKPNLVWLTIGGLYKELFGVIDSLSFSIDDNISWASTVPDVDDTNASEITIQNGETTKYETPYPSVIDVSISMKIIENPQISKGDEITSQGGNASSYSYIYEKDGKSYFTNPYELQTLLREKKEGQPT